MSDFMQANDWREYLRPWKLVTLGIGLSLLIAGSFYFDAPDWDIPISIIMALFAYLFAPWCMRVLLERRYRLWPVAAALTWVSVDGCYAVYWHFKDPRALELMRSANFSASLALYGMCGLLWVYRGSLLDFSRDVGARLRRYG
jgi:hypothetical protein